VKGPLPDPRCTPGSVFRNATPKVFCVSGYTKRVRHVTASMKRKVYAAYSITSHSRGEYEVDHLVPLELGGSNSIANLFPEAALPRPGFHEKDKLENRTNDRACAGEGDWRAMQRQIAKDWTKLAVSLIGR
jgi:5-methylcytosine-specific restriction endonuclease McrA